jgi:NADH dehydrogenase
MMILVVGSTGLVGGMITRSLLARGQDVRILVRRGSGYQPLVDAGAQAVEGDLKVPDSLAAACRGVEVVVTTASAGQRGGADTPETVDLQGNRHLIEAARTAGVRQFVLVSALTASAQSPVPISRAKALAEAALRASGMPWTIIAANAIMDVMFSLVIGGPVRSGQPVTLVGTGNRAHSFVAARDVAAFAVAAVGHPGALNQRIPVGGPAAVSFRDIMATWERVLGRAIPVRWIAPGELLPNLPPVPGLAELVSGLLAWLDTFDSPVEMTELARTFGVTLTTVEDFVAGSAGKVSQAT